jgi:hypothetical protein
MEEKEVAVNFLTKRSLTNGSSGESLDFCVLILRILIVIYLDVSYYLDSWTTL